jgi:hypothetical protein
LSRLVTAGAGVPVVGRVRASLIPACRAQHHPLRLGGNENPRRNLGTFVPVSQALPALALFGHVSSFPSPHNPALKATPGSIAVIVKVCRRRALAR